MTMMRNRSLILHWLLTTYISLSGYHVHAQFPSNYHDNAGVLHHVNPKIGTYGPSPNSNGGMIPSVAPPFAMTRWTPQTRENFISQCPYSDGDPRIHGFQATHQPAIWMGEMGQVVLMPGWGEDINAKFEERGLSFRKEDEKSTPYVYQVSMDADSMGEEGWELTQEAVGSGPNPGGEGTVPDTVEEGANGRVRRSLNDGIRDTGKQWSSNGNSNYAHCIEAALTASSHVGHLRLDFISNNGSSSRAEPYIFIQATRQNWTGSVQIDPSAYEIAGTNPQRQDYKLGPFRAPNFKGYFVSRFSEPFQSHGTSRNGTLQEGTLNATGEHLGAFVRFANSTKRVEVRTAVSFVSIEQARRNLDIEAPDDQSFEATVDNVKGAWLEKLSRITISGVNSTDTAHAQKTIFYSSLFHALQYPNDFSEPLSSKDPTQCVTYSGYTDSVHNSNESYYQSWSIWDTYRAETPLLTLMAPERVNSMVRSLLQIYTWAGWLPMWANLVETNIMIATHVDALVASVLSRGFRSFDVSKAWQAVKKNAFEPPERDEQLLYYDREPYTPQEVRAGISFYNEHGYVPNDQWAESASRTLDYAFDDHAASIVANFAGDNATAALLEYRSANFDRVFNTETSFMRARNANGTWANNTWGWTEGDEWVYTFDVMHNVSGLSSLFSYTNTTLYDKLNEHFEGGHNDHTNEPSHHVPYLYSMLGHPSDTADRVRSIAWENYNASSNGLSGNEDLGQMSAWYVFSALGFYPVNPAGVEYIVGSPFFENVTILWPDGVASDGVVAISGCERLTRSYGMSEPGCRNDHADLHTLQILAPNVSTKPYIKSLTIDGSSVTRPVLTHQQIVSARSIEFETSDTPTHWGKEGVIDG